MTQIKDIELGGRRHSLDELAYRLEQQRILAEFGSVALRATDLESMLVQAVALVAPGMRTTLSKVLCYQPADKKLLIVEGVGWKPGVVGKLRLDADSGSPAGFAFQTGQPVISNHLDKEDKFRTPQFMVEHGVQRAINILIEVHSKHWGVLEVDSTAPGDFTVADLEFMRGFSHLLGVAIERLKAEAELRSAKLHQEMLTREASHRVKNSLAIVSAMLDVQKRGLSDQATIRILSDAQDRIRTVAIVHDMLWREEDAGGVVELSHLICSIAQSLDSTSLTQGIDCKVASLALSADTAITLGLIVNELVTNAIKYASGVNGRNIYITGEPNNDEYLVTVRDEGRGFPENFDFNQAGLASLGMRLIHSLALKINAKIEFSPPRTGGLVKIHMPLPKTSELLR